MVRNPFRIKGAVVLVIFIAFACVSVAPTQAENPPRGRQRTTASPAIGLPFSTRATAESGTITLGSFRFNDQQFGNTFSEDDGGAFRNANWLNIVNLNPGSPGTLTGPSFTTGIANIGLGGSPTYTIRYNTPILNNSGADLGIVSARYSIADTFKLAVSTDGKTFSAFVSFGPTQAVNTGEKASYFYDGAGPYPAVFFVTPVDLSSFGVSAGESISAVKVTGFPEADLIRVAGLRQEVPLAIRGGTGSGPLDPSTVSKPIDKDEIDAQFPLGAQFFLQLVKTDQAGKEQIIDSTFDLNGASIAPTIATATLFPNRVVVEFDRSSKSTIKFFQAVHLGKVSLTITPIDKTVDPVTVQITISLPASLGTAQNAYDSALVDFGHRRGIPPHLLKGQVKQESAFNANAYRYEPLSSDLAYISRGMDLRTHLPYSLYRLATEDGLAQGIQILPADISPRSKYFIVVDGRRRNILDSDEFVSAIDIYTANDANAHWSTKSPPRARRVAANPALLAFTAQTSVSASFGLLQILYPTAIAPMGWTGINGSKNPSNLFDTPVNLLAGGGSLDPGSGYLRRIFGRANPTVNLNDPIWARPLDLANAFKKAFNMYHDNSTVGAYGENVITYGASFAPLASHPIF